MFTISQTLAQFKQDWTKLISEQAIRQACVAAGARWRRCTLSPVVVVQTFLLQILHGNTACDHLSRLTGLVFTGEAYCKARMKLPLAALTNLLRMATDGWQAATADDGLWRGHRLWLVDGTSFSMPDGAQLQAQFGQSKRCRPGCGFPVAHCLALVHAASGLVRDLIIAPMNASDLGLLPQTLARFLPGDVLVSDRGLSSYAHAALLASRGAHVVMRAHQRLNIDFTPGRPHVGPGDKPRAGLPRSRWVRALGLTDQVVEWFRPTACPAWLSAADYAALPERMLVRELRYQIERPGCRTQQVTLVTTLLDAQLYPAEELAGLYLQRWKIETDFAHLKLTLGMDVLRCKTLEGVLKEATMFALAYNLVRMTMRAAAALQGVPCERISFIDTLRWLTSPAPTPPRLTVLPNRPGRNEPRVRKRRPKPYPPMQQPRKELQRKLDTPQPLKT